MLLAGDKGTEMGPETSGCSPPPAQQGPRSSGGASLALVTELACALTTPAPAPGSAGCTGAAAGEVVVTARLLPKALAGRPNCAWLPSSYRSLHFRREARLGWGRYKKHRCCGSASSPFLVPAQSVPVTECPRGNPADRLWCVCARLCTGAGSSEPQRLLHNLLGDLVELLPVVPPHLGGVHVGTTLVVGL